MTTAALLRLCELGKMDLDAPVASMIPGFRMSDPHVSARLTPRHLVTHTGGWVGDYFDDFGDGDDALARMVESIGKLPQITPLGELWSYNNAGFNIAGRLVELACGKPYEKALKELLLDPLGMERTWFYPDDTMITKRFVVGHEKQGGRLIVSRPWAIGRAGNCVGGGVCAAGDLLAWARFMMSGGVNDRGERIMEAATIAEMLEPRVQAGFGRRMGLSWNVREPGGVRICGHGGATSGQQAALHFLPGRDLAATLLTNSESGGILADSLASWMAELWFDARAEKPVPLRLPRLPRRPPPAPASAVADATAGVDPLAECLGLYDLPISAFELRARRGGFTLHEIPRGGFPKPDSPPGDAAPPMRAVLCEGDRFLVLDEPKKGAVGEFLRDRDGKLRWCRLGGRVHVKKPLS
jgi:CubicO group peptidase (beta-lactamase class C family)